MWNQIKSKRIDAESDTVYNQFKEYKKLSKGAESATKQQELFTKATKNCNPELLKNINYTDSLGDAEGTLKINTENAKKSFSGARGALQSFGNVIKGLGATLANFAVMFVISEAISLVMSAVDSYSNRIDNNKTAISEYNEELKNQNDTYNSHKNTISSVSSEYETLSKGVGQYGENISLTSDEYDRYLEISNQIADIYPQLVESYDAQGNAILSCKDNVNALTDALQKEQNAYYNTIKQNEGEKIGAANELIFSDQGFMGQDDKTYSSQLEAIEMVRGLAGKIKSDDKNKEWALGFEPAMLEVLKQSGAIDALGMTEGATKTGGLSYFVTKEDYNELLRYLNSYEQILTNNTNTQYNSAIKPSIDAYVHYNNNDYDNLSGGAKQVVDSIVNSLNYDNFGKDFDAEDPAQYLKDVQGALNTIISQFKGENGDKIGSEWNSMLGVVSDFQNGNISESVFMSSYTKFNNLLTTLGIDTKTRSYICSIIFDSVEIADGVSLEQAIANIVSRTKDESGEIKSYLTSLTLDELKSLYNSKDLTNASLDEIKQKVADIRLAAAVSGSFSVSTEDATKDLNNLSSALSTVKTAIEEYTNNHQLSFSTLNSLLSLDDVYLDMLVNEQGELDLTTDSYKKLAKAQLEQLKASYLQNAIDELSNITTQAKALEYLTSVQENSTQTTLS